MALPLLLLLLLCGGPSLISSTQEFNPRTVVRRDYDMAKLSGPWYSVSIASDDMTRIDEDGDLRIYMRNIQHLENGALQFQFDFRVLGHCELVNMVCEKTERNGEFTVNYKGENKVLVSETDYNLYITFYLRNIQNGTLTQVLALYGKICKRHGLGPQNIINLDNTNICYQV
ncbi:epididymal-specific lipocalin-9 [Erinaceus europaeus]|uniref:Epididymal-specific lipocalin-9 n=1 Tax=Erinaceus europaeus TaxID=9365 RepID=A0A1S2ZMC9_ERIEU|nr:epididymal-specific lipocalin-9 [Erinaceus europaeus]